MMLQRRSLLSGSCVRTQSGWVTGCSEAGLELRLWSWSEEAEQGFLCSVTLSADFTSGYAQIITRASLRARSDPNGARRLLDQLTLARPERTIARDLKTRLGLCAEVPPLERSGGVTRETNPRRLKSSKRHGRESISILVSGGLPTLSPI